MRNPTNIDENSIKHPSRFHQKSMNMRYMGASWGDFGVFGVMLVESDRFWIYFGSNVEGLGGILAPRGWILAFWAPSWGSKWAKIGPESDPNRYPLDDRFED